MKKLFWLSRGLVASLLAAAFLFTACGSKEAEVVDAPADGDGKLAGDLSVYFVDYADQKQSGSNYVFPSTQLLYNLKRKYRDINITSTTFDNHDEFATQVATELSAGKGPDLLLMDYGSQMDWCKLAESNAIENLSPYMKKDKTYKADNYFEPAIKSGQYKDKQYIMPFGFNVMSINTGPQKLPGYDAEGLSYAEILDMLTESVKKANEAEKDSIIPLGIYMFRTDLVASLLTAFGMDFVDYSKSEIILDKEVVKRTCDFVKEYTPYFKKAFEDKYDNLCYTQNAKKVAYTLSNAPYIHRDVAFTALEDVLKYDSQEIMMPKYDDSDGYTGYLTYFAAVNSNSKNKQLAYDSAKAMMDLAKEESIGSEIPVNKEAFKDFIDESKSSDWSTYIDDNRIPIEADTEHITEVVNNVNYVTSNSHRVASIVNNGLQPYIDGTEEFDECYEKTINKLKLYINE